MATPRKDLGILIRTRQVFKLITSSAKSENITEVDIKNLVNTLQKFDPTRIEKKLGSDCYIEAALACAELEDRFPDFGIVNAFYARPNNKK